jgi:hypothetical protein
MIYIYKEKPATILLAEQVNTLPKRQSTALHWQVVPAEGGEAVRWALPGECLTVLGILGLSCGIWSRTAAALFRMPRV